MASQCPWKKKSFGHVVIGIFHENQLKDKYVTNKMEKKCNGKKDIVIFLSNNLKVRGNYEHWFGYKYKEIYLTQCFKIKNQYLTK